MTTISESISNCFKLVNGFREMTNRIVPCERVDEEWCNYYIIAVRVHVSMQPMGVWWGG